MKNPCHSNRWVSSFLFRAPFFRQSGRSAIHKKSLDSQFISVGLIKLYKRDKAVTNSIITFYLKNSRRIFCLFFLIVFKHFCNSFHKNFANAVIFLIIVDGCHHFLTVYYFIAQND